MSEFKRVDKPCAICGAMLYNVLPRRLYCDSCRAELRKHPPEKPAEPKKLTITDIMREADKEGLQYGSYCKKHGLY